MMMMMMMVMMRVMRKPVDVDAVLVLGFHQRVIDSDEDSSAADARTTVYQYWTLISRRRPFTATQRRPCSL